MSSATLFETQRLRLRRFDMGDVDDLLVLNTDPQVLRYIDPSRTTSRENEIASIERLNTEYETTPGLGVWAIECKPDECHSTIAARDMGPYPTDSNFRGLALIRTLYETGEHEVGFRTCPPYWGRGYATEIVRGLLRHGFETVNAEVIVGLAMPENTASRRVLQKVGMHYMGERTIPECAETWPILSHYRLEREEYLRTLNPSD